MKLWKNFFGFFLLMIWLLGITAEASNHDIIIKNGFGEEFTVRHGLFGRKVHRVKDRLGNKYEQKKGLLGSQETEINILGNTYHVRKRKGWFGRGGTDVEGSTIFGDTISTKKGLFGRRTTTVDLSGISTAISHFFKSSNNNKNVGAPLASPYNGLTPQPYLNDLAPAGQPTPVNQPTFADSWDMRQNKP